MLTTCPNCHAKGNVRDEWNGKKAKCPKCQEIFTATPDSSDPTDTLSVPTMHTTPEASATGAEPQPQAEQTTAICKECGTSHPEKELINFDGTLVCAQCKTTYFQKIREGVSGLSMGHQFAGFWIRVAAKLIDSLITGLAGFAAGMGGSFLMMSGDGNIETMATIGIQAAGFLIAIFYTTWFVGKFAATPGKMAVGLKIIKADGAKLTYMQAFGRYWAELLSSITFCIGYLMVAFDRQERRALHDRICQTRVIKNR